MGQLFSLQIGASVITNWGSLIITNQGKFYYKSGQLLQIRATVITDWGSYYKLEQTLLQIRAAITNWGNYYKLGHNSGQHPVPSNKRWVISIVLHTFFIYCTHASKVWQGFQYPSGIFFPILLWFFLPNQIFEMKSYVVSIIS